VQPAIFNPGFFVPDYRPAAFGRWSLTVTPMCLAPGYWSEPALVLGMAALSRDGACWMSISPLELESQEIGIVHARGHVLIFGLGMGWAASATALRSEVTAVTVVERDPEVIALHRTLDIFSQLPEEARAKLAIVEGDAFGYRPEAPVDLLMPDIWLGLVEGDRVAEVRRMQANVQARAVYFWGQELELARHAAAAGRALDEAGIAQTGADFGLPLVGPGVAGYPARVEAVARRLMRDHWLPGTARPF